jgi:hypothetical protein
LTWVSEGKDFRRLRVTLKAGEVFEIAMLAHGTPPLVQTRLIAAPANYHGYRHSGRIASKMRDGSRRLVVLRPLIRRFAPPSPTRGEGKKMHRAIK